MTNPNSAISQSTLLFQEKSYTVSTLTIFAELSEAPSFKKEAENAISAMLGHQLNACGKTNIKVKGNPFLLFINTESKNIYLLSQNAVLEYQLSEFNIVDGYHVYEKIPDIFLIYPNPTELKKIELNTIAKEKFINYKEKIQQNIKNYKPTLFEKFNNFVLSLICDYHTLRTQLLKFIAVVPALTHDNSGITLKNSYIETANNISKSFEKMPLYIKPFFKISEIVSPLFPSKYFKSFVEFNISYIAKRFICTEDKVGAGKIIKNLHLTGRNCTFDQLGELVICQAEADEYCRKILDLINSPELFESATKLNQANIPSHHISIKTSALTPHFNEDPEAFDFVYQDIKPRFLQLFSAAEKYKTYLNFDAEHYHYRELTINLIFYFLEEHKQFNYFSSFGFVVQAYLKDSHLHLEKLLKKAKKRAHAIPLRLVKGAYWDAETIDAKAKNYDSPQFLNKVETDIQYRHLVHAILKEHKSFQLCIASHNVDDHCYAEAVREVYYPQAPIIEHQTLHMTYEPLSMAVAKFGWPMRNYLPTGSLLVGMGYLVRRIMENASQTGVLTATRHHHFSIEYVSLTDELLLKIKSKSYQTDPATDIATSNFKPNNTSHFFLEQEQEYFLSAKIDDYVKEANNTSALIPIYSKFNDNQVLGKIHFQNAADANLAIARATVAKGIWCATSAQDRALFLKITAQLMRLEKFSLSKLIMVEAGKTKLEALGDVDEAIDFLNYYAAQITNDTDNQKEPNGVFAIISPWNFPLAILCGMTAAALSAGNTVIMKPAEQTPFTAMALYELFKKARFPQDVIQILIGAGETVGSALVENIAVNGIAFTGSKQVGIYIYRRSLQLAKENNMLPRSVVTEMGGKNAIIICKDAELDQAISSSIYSSFGHAGQKCSACSRILVHASIIDQFSKRFVARASEIPVGSPELAETFINPLISVDEKEKSLNNVKNMLEACRIYKENLLLDKTIQPGNSLLGPLIIQLNANSLKDSSHPVYLEMFAPLIYLIPFESDEQAIEIFNHSIYALTGGVFTQSDKTIEYFLNKLKVGNLYFNRNITGARVAIEPFGGFYSSGTGPKAGGPDYLNAFQKKAIIPNQEVFDLNAAIPSKELLNKIIESKEKYRFTNQDFQQWFDAFSLSIFKDFLKPFNNSDQLYCIPGQTTYLNYAVKKEDVIFILKEPTFNIFFFEVIYACCFFNIKAKIICLSKETYRFFENHFTILNVNVTEEKELMNYSFSTNLDLVFHNEEPEVFSKILTIFSQEKYYEKKVPKIISLNASLKSNSALEYNKLLFEQQTIAINTMRYGAPLDED